MGVAEIEAVADAVAETRAPTNDAELDVDGDFVATIKVDWSFVDLAVDVALASISVACVVEAGFLDVAAAVVGLAVVVLSSSSSSVAVENGLVATAGGTSVFGESVVSCWVIHTTLPV